MKHRRMYYRVLIDCVDQNGNYYWIQGNKIVRDEDINYHKSFSNGKHFRTFKKAVSWFNNIPVGIKAKLERYDKMTHRSKTWER